VRARRAAAAGRRAGSPSASPVGANQSVAHKGSTPLGGRGREGPWACVEPDQMSLLCRLVGDTR
jgi:hypothetical protein